MSLFTRNFHAINIPPLFAFTLFFIAGIIFNSAVSLFLTIFLFLLCCCGFAYKKNISTHAQLVACSFFMLAGAWLHQKELRDYHDFYAFIENKKWSSTWRAHQAWHANPENSTNLLTHSPLAPALRREGQGEGSFFQPRSNRTKRDSLLHHDSTS